MRQKFDLSKCCEIGKYRTFLLILQLTRFIYYLDNNALMSISDLNIWWEIGSFKGGIFA